MKRYFLTCMIFIILSSCAYVISREGRQGALTDISFSRILNNPSVYLNQTFILGGIIVETINTKVGSEIEVVQVPIDSFGNITDSDFSEGRFIIVISRYFDPLIYKNGRHITIAGKLIGSRKKPLGEIDYDYPVFEAKEIYLWREERYYYPYPYMYDPYFYYPYYYSYPYYWHDPYWRRPFLYR